MKRSVGRIARLAGYALILGLVALPAQGSGRAVKQSDIAFQHLSQGMVFRYWMAHPDQAPAGMRGKFEALASARAHGVRPPASLPAAPPFGDRFNDDVIGYPQNEESIAQCRLQGHILIGGTNDYRGILDPDGNFTGWHLSIDGGTSLAKEGLLPPVVNSQGEPRPRTATPSMPLTWTATCTRPA
jgi:hypothetical protein